MKLHLCLIFSLPAVLAAALPADGSILTILNRDAIAGGYAYIEDPYEEASDSQDDQFFGPGTATLQGAVNIGNEETAFAQGGSEGSLIANNNLIRIDGNGSAMFCSTGELSPFILGSGGMSGYVNFSVSENVLVDLNMSMEVFGSLSGISNSNHDGYVGLSDINGEYLFLEGLSAGDLDGSDSISFSISGLLLQPGEYYFEANLGFQALQFNPGEGCADISGHFFGEIGIASSAVPEPSSITVFGSLLGFVGLGSTSRRTRRLYKGLFPTSLTC